jgi:hypothetical protein
MPAGRLGLALKLGADLPVAWWAGPALSAASAGISTPAADARFNILLVNPLIPLPMDVFRRRAGGPDGARFGTGPMEWNACIRCRTTAASPIAVTT